MAAQEELKPIEPLSKIMSMTEEKSNYTSSSDSTSPEDNENENEARDESEAEGEGPRGKALDLRMGSALKRSISHDDMSECSRNKMVKRRPTDQELALNFFIKQLAVEFLDRRLTIVQQPRHRLAQLESACHRQFPAFNERQIRLKIRGQLKLYRRNLKKAEERKAANALARVTPIINPSSTSNTMLSMVPSNSACLPQPSRCVHNAKIHNPSNNIQAYFPNSENYIASNPTAVVLAQKALMNERRQAAASELIRQHQDKLIGGDGHIAASSWHPEVGSSAGGGGGGTNQFPMFPKLPELRPNLSNQPRLPLNLPINTMGPQHGAIRTSAVNNVGCVYQSFMRLAPQLQRPGQSNSIVRSSKTLLDTVPVIKPEHPSSTVEILNTIPSVVNVKQESSSINTTSGVLQSTLSMHQQVNVEGEIPTDVNDHSMLNQSLFNASTTANSTMSEEGFLNQTWPPIDPSANIIASCLRLTANFLLQSAVFFETKGLPLPLPPMGLSDLPSNISPLLTSPLQAIFPPMPPGLLGPTMAPLQSIPFQMKFPTQFVTQPPFSEEPQVSFNQETPMDTKTTLNSALSEDL